MIDTLNKKLDEDIKKHQERIDTVNTNVKLVFNAIKEEMDSLNQEFTNYDDKIISMLCDGNQELINFFDRNKYRRNMQLDCDVAMVYGTLNTEKYEYFLKLKGYFFELQVIISFGPDGKPLFKTLTNSFEWTCPFWNGPFETYSPLKQLRNMYEFVNDYQEQSAWTDEVKTSPFTSRLYRDTSVSGKNLSLDDFGVFIDEVNKGLAHTITVEKAYQRCKEFLDKYSMLVEISTWSGRKQYEIGFNSSVPDALINRLDESANGAMNYFEKIYKCRKFSTLDNFMTFFRPFIKLIFAKNCTELVAGEKMLKIVSITAKRK